MDRKWLNVYLNRKEARVVKAYALARDINCELAEEGDGICCRTFCNKSEQSIIDAFLDLLYDAEAEAIDIGVKKNQ